MSVPMMRGARKHTLAVRDPEQHVRVCTSTAAFVYLLPCRYEDILKVGFSRDPLGRMQTLHPRYFEFFDLDRVLLVGTETVGDARRLEDEVLTAGELHNAPAPLLVRPAAGGHTEWYRGAYPLLSAAILHKAATAGFALHAPAADWLRAQLERRALGLYESTSQLWRALESAQAHGEAATALQEQLRNQLDACAALGLSVAQRVPPAVLSWYQLNSHWTA